MSFPSNSDGLLLDLWLRWSQEETARIEQQEVLKRLFAEAKEGGLNPKHLRAAFRRQYAAIHETQAERTKRDADDDATDELIAALARVRMRVREERPQITEPAAPVHAPAQVRADAPGAVPHTAASGATESRAHPSVDPAGGGVAPLLAGAEGDTDRQPIPLAADAPHAAQTVGNPPPDHSPAESETVAISAPIHRVMTMTSGPREANGLKGFGTTITFEDAPKSKPKHPKRPHCRKPDTCGSSGPFHCFGCQEALAEAQGFTP